MSSTFSILVLYNAKDNEVVELFQKIQSLGVEQKGIYVVDNSNSKKYRHLATGLGGNYVVGSNRYHEFSGYMEGLDAIGRSGDAAEQIAIVVCNDTFNSHRPQLIEGRLMRRAISRSRKIGGNCLWGAYDYLPMRTELFGIECQEYFTSHYFLMAGQRDKVCLASNILPEMCECERRLKTYICGSVDEWGYGLDETYRLHIMNWLFSSGWKGWYAAQPFSRERAAHLRNKALSINLEHSLMGRLKKTGFTPIRFGPIWNCTLRSLVRWSQLKLKMRHKFFESHV